MVDGKKYERKMGKRNVAQMKNNNNTNPFIKKTKQNKTKHSKHQKLKHRERERERESTTKGLSYIAQGKHFRIAFNI